LAKTDKNIGRAARITNKNKFLPPSDKKFRNRESTRRIESNNARLPLARQLKVKSKMS
jgi:hypothetical protein